MPIRLCEAALPRRACDPRAGRDVSDFRTALIKESPGCGVPGLSVDVRPKPNNSQCAGWFRRQKGKPRRSGASIILEGKSYRHGLRASELCDLQWSQVELATGRLHVRRAKNGSPSLHPMGGRLMMRQTDCQGEAPCQAAQREPPPAAANCINAESIEVVEDKPMLTITCRRAWRLGLTAE